MQVEDYARHLQSYLASSPVQELVRAGPEGLARALTLACAHTRCVQDAAWMTDCERACVMLVELQAGVAGACAACQITRAIAPDNLWFHGI